jgi:hypothetical protein
MEPEGSLLCSQETTTGPYPEPHESTPNLPILFPKSHSNIIFHLFLCLGSGLFPSSSPSNFLRISHVTRRSYNVIKLNAW